MQCVCYRETGRQHVPCPDGHGTYWVCVLKWSLKLLLWSARIIARDFPSGDNTTARAIFWRPETFWRKSCFCAIVSQVSNVLSRFANVIPVLSGNYLRETEPPFSKRKPISTLFQRKRDNVPIALSGILVETAEKRMREASFCAVQQGKSLALSHCVEKTGRW